MWFKTGLWYLVLDVVTGRDPKERRGRTEEHQRQLEDGIHYNDETREWEVDFEGLPEGHPMKGGFVPYSFGKYMEAVRAQPDFAEKVDIADWQRLQEILCSSHLEYSFPFLWA
tara:strand:+ start:1901 stop:2239 length:339 start_codon:yes stop_codon:yes gene_type:complete